MYLYLNFILMILSYSFKEENLDLNSSSFNSSKSYFY